MKKLHLKWLNYWCSVLFRCFCQAVVKEDLARAERFRQRYFRADKKRRALMKSMGVQS